MSRSHGVNHNLVAGAFLQIASLPLAALLVCGMAWCQETGARPQEDSPELPPVELKFTAPVNQAPVSTPENSLPVDPQAVFVLEGMKAARAQLRSGVCDVDFLNNFGAPKPTDSAAATGVRGKITFSEDIGLRQEWIYPKHYADRVFLGHPDDVPIESTSQERTGYYVRTRDQSLQWFQGRGNIDILLPDAPAPPWSINFNLKAVGFASWVEFNRCLTWETLVEIFLKKPTSSVAQPSEHIYVLTWQLGSENSEWIVTVDESQGFGPIHAMMRQRLGNDAPWRTVQDFTTTWKKISSAWVPVHHQAKISQLPEKPPTQLQIDFSWQIVNEPIPESRFEVASFGAPETVAVLNSTLGSPVVTKPAQRSFATHEEPKSQFSRQGSILVGLNVLVLAGLLIFWLVRTRTSQRGHDGSGTVHQ